MVLRKACSLFSHKLCTGKCLYELLYFVPLVVIAYTLVDLRRHVLQNELEHKYEPRAVLLNTGHPEKTNEKQYFQEAKIIPALDEYPPEFHKAIKDAYNVSYQQLATIRNKNTRMPLTPGKMHVRLVLVSTWRSGSSFATELLVSHPGAYYQAEPLHIFGIKRVYSDDDPLKSDAYEIVKNILKCNNAPFKERVPKEKWPNIYWFQHEQNHLYHQQCANRKFLQQKQFCGSPSYLDGICRAIPIQVTKLDRINLKFMSPLLFEEEIGETTKILYLVRDPRGVISSRKEFPWCVNEVNCINAKYLCQDMVQDYNEAKSLSKKEPTKFRAVRYEDFVTSMFDESEKLFDFMGLDMQDITREFIAKATHPDTNEELPHNVHIRDPNQVIAKWKTKLSMQEINKIQKDCQQAMKLWGYLPIKNTNSPAETYTPSFSFP